MKLLLTFLIIGFSINPQITGTWKANDHGQTVILILNADGTGKIDNESFKYVVKESVITVTSSVNNEVNVYNFTLNGNTLKFSGGDLDETITFMRVP